MHVNEASLRSVLAGSPDRHVYVIDRDWIPEEEESDYEDSEDEGVEAIDIKPID